jgi:hydroxyacylglutathione hydrolase
MNLLLFKLSVTNCYLIPAKDRWVLVDTGYDWEWEPFCAGMKALNLTFADITHLILTHHHDDHSGLVGNVLKENPSIKMIMSHHAPPLLLKGMNDHASGGGYINRRVNLLLSIKRKLDKRWTFTFPSFVPRTDDILIECKTSLREVGIELDGSIVETPGHSVDSISVLLDNGDCIVGDAAANFLQFAGTKYCVVYIENLDRYYESWTRLIDAGTKWVYPSHGNSFGIDKLKRYINVNKKSNMVAVSL